MTKEEIIKALEEKIASLEAGSVCEQAVVDKMARLRENFGKSKLTGHYSNMELMLIRSSVDAQSQVRRNDDDSVLFRAIIEELS
jgi:hypothetical protein